jgi:hypothetical protein
MALIKTDEAAVTVAAYKKANGIEAITICKSRKGKLYAIDAESGDFLFMIQDGIDVAKPPKGLVIQEYQDDETDELTYYAYVPGPAEVLGTW